jgi:N-acetylmuramoyl-L-alanine amidase
MPRSKTEYIFIHCSATRPSQDWVDAEEIDKWHRARGFFSIGYSFVIKRDGTIEEGRDLDEPTASQKGYNHNSISICMVGGVTEDDVKVSEDNFTESQWTSLKDLILKMQSVYPEAKIVGHNEYSKKDCPSFDVQKWIEENPL